MKTVAVTRQGLEKMKSELEETRVSWQKSLEDLKRYRDMGDLSENSAYRAAKFKTNSLSRRMQHLEKIVSRARAVDITDRSVINIGAVVTLENESGLVSYTIVSGYESDTLKGLISIFSPLGRALVGKKAGMELEFKTPSGLKAYRIITVSYH